MAIDTESRYYGINKYVSEDVTGRKQEGFELRQLPKVSGFFYYAPNEVERLDHVANMFYHDPKKFWKICDASGVLDPFDVIVPGRQVLIPPNK